MYRCVEPVDWLPYVRRMVEAAEKSQEYVRGVPEAGFVAGEVVYDAVLMQLVIIAEAASRVPPTIRDEFGRSPLVRHPCREEPHRSLLRRSGRRFDLEHRDRQGASAHRSASRCSGGTRGGLKIGEALPLRARQSRKRRRPHRHANHSLRALCGMLCVGRGRTGTPENRGRV